MKTRGLCLVCVLLLGTSLVLADVSPPRSTNANTADVKAARAAQPGVTGEAQPAVVGTEQAADGVALLRGPGGERKLGSECAGPDPNNPVPYLCGQNQAVVSRTWQYSDYTFVNLPYGSGRVICESYPPPGETITADVGILSWHGTYLENSTSNGCTKDHLFRIIFYPDSGGAPNVGAPACVYDNVVPVQAEIVGQLNFEGGTDPANDYAFTAVLPTACSLRSGWFSIASIQASPDCYHLIGPSDEGNGLCWRYWADNPSGGATMTNDIGYCMAENKVGACCDDCNPVACNSNSNEWACGQIGGRFEEAPATCGTMSPPCGEATGACCKDDGTCEVMGCQDCLTFADAYWAGPDTDCNDCCVVVCVNNENEPRCGDDYDDMFNAGCNAETPIFSPISCDVTICGESGNFRVPAPGPCAGDASCDGRVTFGDINPFVDGMLCVSAPDPAACWAAQYPCDYLNCDTSGDGQVTFGDINPFVDMLLGSLPIPCPTVGARDMDWFEFTSLDPFEYTFTVNAEFDPVVWVVAYCTGCDDDFNLEDPVSGNRCQDVSISARCMPAGTYWFIVSTDGFEGVDCGADYKAWLTCTPCEPCQRSYDPGEAGYQLEGEPCGQSTNGGCADPNDPNDVDEFSDIVFAEDPPGTGKYYAAVCGSTWAEYFPDEGLFRRDIDWYRYNMPGQASVYFSIDNEIPVHMTPVFTNAAGDPYVCGGDLYGYWTVYGWWDGCNQRVPLYETIRAGDNFIFIAPEDGDTNPIWEGYPCCFGQNDYILRVNYGEPNCPDNIDCNDNPDIKENEIPCFDGYIDTYNGGCDVNPPKAVIPLPGGFGLWAVCGVSAYYHETVDPNSPLVRDADWYTFELEDASWLCIEGLSELPIDVNIYGPMATLDCNMLDPNLGLEIFNGYFAACGDYDQDPIGGPNWTPDPNDPDNENRPQMPAGNYWMRVAVQEGWDDITCGLGWEYLINLTDDRSCPDTQP